MIALDPKDGWTPLTNDLTWPVRQKHSGAYHEGVCAFKTWSQNCPYEIGAEAWRQWHDGWRDAERFEDDGA